MNDLPNGDGAGKLHENTPVTPAEAENVFEKALRAKNERAMMPVSRVVKKPTRIKPTRKSIKGWFRCHPTFLIHSIDVFQPKEEGVFSDEPIFILPDLAAELRLESTAFENAIHEVNCYLVATKSGTLHLFLAPLPDPVSGRHHAAVEQKIDAVEAARTRWMRLEWNKTDLQFDIYTAEGEIAEPKWPEDISDAGILLRAFGARNVIKSNDDPLLIKFRGEA
jgi:hypothetical protein